MRVILIFVALTAAAWAGNAPPSELPWDSVMVVDTVLVKGGDVIDTGWVHYITKVDYQIFLYGEDYADALETRKQTKLIKKLLERREARKKP